jgi:hypothetical protein
MDMEKNNSTKPTLGQSLAAQQIKYQLKGRIFIVQPVFLETGPETVTSVLTRLVQADLMNL